MLQALPRSGCCLQIHRLVTGLYATIVEINVAFKKSYAEYSLAISKNDHKWHKHEISGTPPPI
jgi:hypothetical protein